MPSKAQRELESPQQEEIIAQDQRLMVLEALISGKSLAALSRESGIAKFVLEERKREVKATLVQGYHDDLEYARARASARLEKMYQAIEPVAYGIRKNPSTEKLEPSGIPDLQWMKLLREVILSQLEVYKADEALASEKREKGVKLNYTQVQHLTLVAGQEMFTVAQQTMWHEFQNRTPAEMEAMLLESGEIPDLDLNLQNADIKELTKRVQSLGENFTEVLSEND